MDKLIDKILDRSQAATARQGAADRRFVEIDARQKPQLLDLAELWHFRDLVLLLGLRDFQVRYRQTAVGVLWVLFQPLVYVIVLSPVFGNLNPYKGPNPIPYWLIAFTGLVPWQLFSGTVSMSSGCLLGNQGLLTKVYFPRVVLPLSSIFVVLIDFLIASFVLIMLIAINRGVSWQVLAAPVFVVWTLIAAFGIGTGLSALNALYRDVSTLIPFFLQLGLVASPVFYESSLVHDAWRLPFAINPMCTTIRGFRWALLQTPPPALPEILVSATTTVAFLFVGLWYFQRTERRLADII